MRATDILKELLSLGIVVRAEDGRIKGRAPAGALSEEMRVAILQHKAELLALLSAPEVLWTTLPDLAPATVIESFIAERDRLRAAVEDARTVANWFHGLLYRVHRQGHALAQDGSEIPVRLWISFDHEPLECPGEVPLEVQE